MIEDVNIYAMIIITEYFSIYIYIYNILMYMAVIPSIIELTGMPPDGFHYYLLVSNFI